MKGGETHMTIDEAEALMSESAYERLREVVTVRPVIDTSKKAGNDILMSAFCKAVAEEVIKSSSLDDKLTKLLNSATNTLSQQKLKYLLEVVHKSQPDIKCVITITTADMQTDVFEVEYHTPDAIDFLTIFRWLLDYFNITPSSIRNKLSETLKPTIVNNISQLVSRVQQNNTEDLIISITTITRLVNCHDHLIFARFE